MIDEKIVSVVVQIILIVAAVNWGAVGYDGTDVVNMISFGFDKQVKMIVGVVGIYAAYQFYVSMRDQGKKE